MEPVPDVVTLASLATALAVGPVTVVVVEKAATCPLMIHVRDLPLYDYREALRPATRPLPPNEEEYEES